MRIVAALAGSLALALGAPGTAQKITILEAVTQPDAEAASTADEVRFKTDPNQRMTVPVHLSGSGPYRFMVDTGADRSAISHQLATRLQLASGPSARLHSISGVALVQTANVPRIELQQKVVHDVDAALLDAGNMGADGILGSDSLRSQRVVFDFKARTMAIVPSSRKTAPDDRGAIVVNGRLRNGRLLLTHARIDDQLIDVVIDTGSEITVGNSALRRRLSRRGMLRAADPTVLQSVTGQSLAGEYTVVEQLRIGEVSLEKMAIVFADAHTFDQLDLNRRPALLLGMNAMRAFERVSIDFANKKMRVRMPPESGLRPIRSGIR